MSKPSQIKKQLKEAKSQPEGPVSKSKLLLALQDEVLRLRKELHAEKDEREKISSWLFQTLKPKLGSELADLKSSVESNEQQIGVIRQFLRDNRESIVGSGGGGGSDSVSREEFDELQKALAIEREARQQLSLWIKQQFGKKLELLDERILSVTGGQPKVNTTAKSTVSVLPDSVTEWLRMIGYERYIDEFQRFKCTDLDKVTRLTDDHLVKMGIALKRHRGDLLHEVAALKAKLDQLNDLSSDFDPPASTPTPKRSDDVDLDGPDPFSDETLENRVEEEFQEKQRRLEEEKQRLKAQFEREKEQWMEQERERIRKEVEREEREKVKAERRKSALMEKERQRMEDERNREREQARIRAEIEREEREKIAAKAAAEKEKAKKVVEQEKLKKERELQLQKEKLELEKERARLRELEEEQRSLKEIEKEKQEIERQRREIERARAELEKAKSTPDRDESPLFSSPKAERKSKPVVLSDDESDLFPETKPAKVVKETKTKSIVSTQKKSTRSDADDGRPNEDYIADVRSDSCGTNWVLFYFDKASNSVKYENSGAKGHSELLPNFSDQKVQYAFLRVMDTKSRIKFIYIQWIGEKANFMTRSRSGTCKASVLKLMGQYHLEIIAETLDDISKQTILSKLSAAVNF